MFIAINGTAMVSPIADTIIFNDFRSKFVVDSWFNLTRSIRISWKTDMFRELVSCNFIIILPIRSPEL